MVRKIDWESQLGRRLKLRDLHVFLAVVQRGSMSKAAEHLGVSQAAVSEIVADLEHAVRVRLLDRRPHGIEPTAYGHALVKRILGAFDELKQGIRDIECLADPTVGEVRMGCAESIASAILSPIIERFSLQYPRVMLEVKTVVSPTLELPDLRQRTLDLFLARLNVPFKREDSDLNVEFLEDDATLVAAGAQSRWARCREIDLAELVNEPWILTPPGSWSYVNVAEAFHARGLDMPRVCLKTFSIHLRTNLLASGHFISAFPRSFLRLHSGLFSLKPLPIDLPARAWPLAIVTLKNRTLSPVVQCFIEHVRAFAHTMGTEASHQKKSA